MNSELRLTSFLFFSILVSMALNACDTPRGANAMCDYQTYDFKVKIVDLKIEYRQQPKDTIVDVIVEFLNTPLAGERKSMGAMRDIEIDLSSFRKNSFEIGNIYIGELSILEKGNCVPYIYSFTHTLR